jgi:hypothetical protein
MPKLSPISVGFLVLAACMPPKILGQGGPCLATGADTLSTEVLIARRQYSEPDSAGSVNHGIPWARRNQIYAVNDSATCAQAVAAVNTAKGNPNTVSQVYVISIGNSGFLVPDPVAAPDGRRSHWLFDSTWQQLRLAVEY